MAFAHATNRNTGTTGGGGGGEQQRWKKDLFNQTVAWTAGGLVFNLSSTPVDSDAITIWSQGLILHPDDYTVLSSPARIQIDFDGDPAVDTEAGTWSFIIQYPYLL